jgi:hypothetical protein
MQYFYERSKAADVVVRNTQMVYSTRMTEYLEKAQEKALFTRSERSLTTSLLRMKFYGDMGLSARGKCV